MGRRGQGWRATGGKLEEMIHRNVITNFCSREYEPRIDPTAHVHSLAAVIGHVFVRKEVLICPFASVRGDEGHPIFIGDGSNVQDGVVIHALETERDGRPIENNLVTVKGKKYAVYVGKRVSLAHQVQVHGPAYVGDDTFVGMKSLVFRARVGKRCVIEPGCIIIGVRIRDGRYVPAGTVLQEHSQALAMKAITEEYPLRGINRAVVHVNASLACGYNRSKEKP
jgi:carbonic anhydrase/acetyltransferase-like protein (isoleucine patch superfamily)